MVIIPVGRRTGEINSRVRTVDVGGGDTTGLAMAVGVFARNVQLMGMRGMFDGTDSQAALGEFAEQFYDQCGFPMDFCPIM